MNSIVSKVAWPGYGG